MVLASIAAKGASHRGQLKGCGFFATVHNNLLIHCLGLLRFPFSSDAETCRWFTTVEKPEIGTARFNIGRCGGNWPSSDVTLVFLPEPVGFAARLLPFFRESRPLSWLATNEMEAVAISDGAQRPSTSLLQITTGRLRGLLRGHRLDDGDRLLVRREQHLERQL
jgi:hypothetical protein